MRTLILGGSGLIGRATAACLAKAGDEVTVASRTRPEQLPGAVHWEAADITDAAALNALLARLRPAGVVHLASFLQFACERDPREAIRVNLEGTLNVLEACCAADVPRVVYGSSIAVYGERRDTMREDDPPAARASLYGMTKRFGEMLGERHMALYGLMFVALRYSGVFGAGRVHSPGMALVRQRIRETALGRDVEVDASGDERAHLTHASDAAEATRRALSHPRPAYSVYNVAGPPENYVSLREFHAELRALAPHGGAVRWAGRGPQAGPVDSTRLAVDLGYAPQVTLREGLARDLGAE